MDKVICIGSACKDIFFPTADGLIIETPEDLTSQVKLAFELGAKYKIESRFESLGGCAVNVACGLSKLGIEVDCYSKIGGDASGIWIAQELEKNNVGMDFIEIEKELPSDLSSIIVEQQSGERIIFSNQKVNGTLKIREEKLVGAGWFFIGDLHGNWEGHLDIIFEIARVGDVKVAFNPRQSNIHDNAEKILDMIPFTQILFINKDEAIEVVQIMNPGEDIGNLNDEEFLVKRIKESGAGVVALTDGSRGAWGCDDGNSVVHVAAQKVQAVDSTGAGDAFSSGFLASYIRGNDLDECLRWGIANGGNVVGFYGGVEGLLDENKILEKIN